MLEGRLNRIHLLLCSKAADAHFGNWTLCANALGGGGYSQTQGLHLCCTLLVASTCIG